MRLPPRACRRSALSCRRIARHRRCGCARGDAPVGGLVLEAPFTSAADIGAAAYWFLPVRLLIRTRSAPTRGSARCTRRCWSCTARATTWSRSGSASGCSRSRTNPSVSCGSPTAGHSDLDRYGGAGCGAVVPRPVSALKPFDALAPPAFPPLRLNVCRVAADRRGGGTWAGCGHVGSRGLDFVGTKSFLRRWVSPITVSAALLALTTAFCLDDATRRCSTII